MWFNHSMSIAQQLMPIYNTTVHKNKSTAALNVANFRAIRHQHAQGWSFIIAYIITYIITYIIVCLSLQVHDHSRRSKKIPKHHLSDVPKPTTNYHQSLVTTSQTMMTSRKIKKKSSFFEGVVEATMSKLSELFSSKNDHNKSPTQSSSPINSPFPNVSSQSPIYSPLPHIKTTQPKAIQKRFAHGRSGWDLHSDTGNHSI